MLFENQIYCPAASNVRAFTTEVYHERLIVATGIEKGISENQQPSGIEGSFGHLAILVDTFRNAANRAVIPGKNGGRQRR